MTISYPCGMVVTMNLPLTPSIQQSREDVLRAQCDNEHAVLCRVCGR